MRSQKFIGYLDGSIPCPPAKIIVDGHSTPHDNPAHTLWVDQDQMILSLLVSSLSAETLPYAVGVTTSFDLWKALESAFASPSNTRILNIHMNLQHLCRGNLSVIAYLQKAKGFADELAAAGRLNRLLTLIYIFLMVYALNLKMS